MPKECVHPELEENNKKNKKNTDGLSACRKADVDCILMANILVRGALLHFLSCSSLRGKKKKNTFKRGQGEAKETLVWKRGQTVNVQPTKD